jgi:hypothetical protein
MSTQNRPARGPRDQDEEITLGHDDPAWLDRWAPKCPDGNPQRLCEIIAFRLKGADYLQLRVALRPADNGVCRAIVDEHPDRIYVRALACLKEDPPRHRARRSQIDETDCPCNVWLDGPLAERIVIDFDSNEPLPLYIPRWGTGEPSLCVPRPPGNLWPPAH